MLLFCQVPELSPPDEPAKNDTKHISRIKNSDQINLKPQGSTGK